MTPGCNLCINLFVHKFSFLCVRDDGIHLTRRALTKLEKEGQLISKLDTIEHVSEG
jgi:hypothetical protein